MPQHRVRTGGQGHGHESAGGDGDDMQQYQAVMENHDPNVTYCCVPTGCHLGVIRVDQLRDDAVKVLCNNEQCVEGQFMHKACFEEWEESVLTYLRSTGRARSWSEKQRLQNLWTKKGYDLAYKACGCKCGKGHLRKDLDWMPPPAAAKDDNANHGANNGNATSGAKKKKHRRKKNDKPTLTMTGTQSQKQVVPTGGTNGLTRLRSSSMSSTGSGSPPMYPEFLASPTRVDKSKALLERRERHASGNIFSRRQDYSSFNTLPRHKINSYHIKMEDEGSHGNDETRCFILSTLSANKMAKVACILCHNTMLIFDRYPLIDGTFFLSPRQHSQGAVQVKVDGGRAPQYLNAVCMACLEGWNARLRCRFCKSRWNGSDLILGSMYSYDIFAATPCCTERLRCTNCSCLVIMPDRQLEFFSDYSRDFTCPQCYANDYHFVKPLAAIYDIRSERE